LKPSLNANREKPSICLIPFLNKFFAEVYKKAFDQKHLNFELVHPILIIPLIDSSSPEIPRPE